MKTMTSIIKGIKPNTSEIYYPLTAGSLPAFSTKGPGGSRSRTKATASDAIDVQARHGIQFPSTGEPAATNNNDMVLGFFQAFEGINVTSEGADVTGEIKAKSVDHLVGLDVIKEVEQAKEAVDQLVKADKYPDFIALKATLSGPGLLAQKANSETHSVQTLMGRFSEGLVEIAHQMYEKGARIIQIDEPLFTTGRKYRLQTIQALQSLIAQLRLQLPELVFISLHTCGSHSQETLNLLEKLDVELLDLEFKHHDENFGVVTNDWLESNGKNVGVGIVDGHVPLVETEIEIGQEVNRIFEMYNPEFVVLKPDCQLRLRTAEEAQGKLGMVQQARQKALALLSKAY
jgi:5-methyltetrahydropteroyltriglutamate--homocysteine methyltransferase